MDGAERRTLYLEDHRGRPLTAARTTNLLRLSAPDGPVELSATELGKLLEYVVDMFFPKGG